MAAKHAPSIGRSIVNAPVISATRTMPVTGACTTPVKKAAMPTTAKAVASTSRAGKAIRAEGADEHAELRSENQHRREQPARRRRGVRGGAEDEAQQEGQRDQGHHCPSGEHSLGNRVTAAD